MLDYAPPVLDASTPTSVPTTDFRMRVDSGGRVQPAMLAGLKGDTYLEALTFYGLVGDLLGSDGKPTVVVFQVAFSNIGPFPTCQVSVRLKMPGAQETLSLNLPAKHYHALNTNAMSRVTVHAPADGFEAVIAQSFETRTVHLELRCPVHGVDVSLVLRTAERGYALDGGRVYYYGSTGTGLFGVAGLGGGSTSAFVSTLPPGHVRTRPKADGYVLENFLPVTTFSGTLCARGVTVNIPRGTGAGLFTHAYARRAVQTFPLTYIIDQMHVSIQAMKPHLAAHRWTVFLLYDHTCRALLHMVRWRTSPAYGGVEIYQGAYCVDGVVLRVCGGVGNAIGQGRPDVVDTVSGYSVPQCLVLQWASQKPSLPKHLLSTELISDGSGMLMPDGGGIVHGAAAPPPLIQTAASTSGSTRATSFRAMCTVPLDYLLGRHDVLDRLPALLRLVIRRFVVNPFIYQWLETARAEVEEEDGGVVTLQGATLVECAFLG